MCMCFFLAAWPECWICIENWEDYQHEQLLKWKFLGLEVVLNILSVPAGAAHFLCANLCHIFNFSKMSCPICQVNFFSSNINKWSQIFRIIDLSQDERRKTKEQQFFVSYMCMHSFRVDSNQEVLLAAAIYHQINLLTSWQGTFVAPLACYLFRISILA